MKLIKPAVAGTLESSDVQVTVEPREDGETGIELSIASSVLNQYGRQIRKTALDALERLQVDSAKVALIDKGALDLTIAARVECAVFRACGVDQGYPWGGAIRP